MHRRDVLHGRLVERQNVYVASGTPQARGTVAEPAGFYPYQLDDAKDVPDLASTGLAWAGRACDPPTGRGASLLAKGDA